MTMLTKLIFGLRATLNGLVVTISGAGRSSAPALTIIDSSGSRSVAYDEVSETWHTELTIGDYIFKLELSEEDWFNGALTVTFAENKTSIFVFHGPETAAPNAHETLAWTANSTAAGSDPKDPWPPPAAVATTLPTGSYTWFDSELHTARLAVLTPKALDAA